MRRFYREAEIADAGGGFAVVLDGKPAKTPAKTALTVPVRALAEAIVEEWRAQTDDIRPDTMPLTRLAGAALDQVAPRRTDVIREVAAYAGTDLVCYRAAIPPELSQRQTAEWQPLMDWVTERYGARLEPTDGIRPIDQPAEALERLSRAVARFDDFSLTALHAVTAACGSLVIALALAGGRIDPEAAFAVSQLDESYQIERWGADADAEAHRAALQADIAIAARFLALSRA